MDRVWKFPKKDDIGIVEKKFVFYGPVQATTFSKSGWKFGSDDEGAFKLELDFFIFSYYLEDIVPENVCYDVSAT